jgi:hypothetical protein
MLRRMRTGVVLLSLWLLLALPAVGDAAVPYWSIGKVLRRLDGTAVQVASRKIRIDSDTTLCGGYGESIRRAGVRMWRHFHCTYTTFTRALVDRDLEFRLHVRDATRFSITNAHWVRGPLASGS